MCRLRVIRTDCTDPYVNLAAEEHLTMNAVEGVMTLFLWQNAHTVVIGKNQNPWRECDVEAIKRDGIYLARRISGGGAVYHDLGNLNFTFIQDAAGKEPDLGLFCRPVAQAIRTLGAEAEVNGRNDITVNGMKFSGNAQYVKYGRVMHHGTLLFDSQLEVAAKALRPDPEKIKAKGVASVRSRITNLKPLLPEGTTLEIFREALLKALFEKEQMEVYTLTDADLTAIAALKDDRYGTWAWNWGASPACDMTFSGRIEGCGQLSLQFRVKKGFITDAILYGDFFSAGDPQSLAKAFIGFPATPDGFRDAAQKADVSPILGLTTEALLDILLK